MTDGGSPKSFSLAASNGERAALAEARARAVQRLRQKYRFYPKPSGLIRHFLQAAVDATGSDWGEVRLREASPEANSEGRGGRFVVGDIASLKDVSGATIPIGYQNRALGVLRLLSRSVGHYTRESVAAGEVVASELARHLKRYEVNCHLKEKFCRDLMLVGLSETLRRADIFVEKAAMVDLPVLLMGEFGVEKQHLAYAIHALGRRADGPFKEVNCAALSADAFGHDLFELFRQSDRGTIFFEGIDALDYALQLQLLNIFNSGVGEWASAMKQAKPVDVRVVASAGPLLRERAGDEKFSRRLLAALDFLSISLAPLRERKEDLKPLTEYFLWKYSTGQPPEVADEVFALFRQYEWPANVGQFERTMACLATMSSETLTLEDVRLNAPEVAETGAEERSAGHDEGGHDGAQNVIPLVSRLIKREPTDLKDLHVCLRKALTYLAYNYSKEVPLGVLAQYAGISSSHLCHLFRKELNANFKAVLSALRIERAKHLLLERPGLTTAEVSNKVGFSDPRHYQRLFKQMVGCTSREYRLRYSRQGELPPQPARQSTPRG